MNEETNTPLGQLHAALIQACEAGDVAEAHRLLYLGAEPPACHENLIEAARRGSVYGVTLALALGCDINATDRHAYTALQWAAELGHLGVIRLLVENGADLRAHCVLDAEPVQLAAHGDQLEAVKLLLELGADINCEDDDGWTLVRIASEQEDTTEMLAYLLEQGAKAATQDCEGWSPLHTAAARGNLEAIRLLLHYGAEVNAVCVGEFGKEHTTPLDVADEVSCAEAAALLIEHGAQTGRELRQRA